MLRHNAFSVDARQKHFRDFPSCLEFNFRFEKILAELESHVDERIASGSYNALRLHLVPFVQKLLGSKDFPERLILTAAAVLDNNCFEISMPLRGVEIGGLFLTSLILCHDCVPNTKHFVNFIEADLDVQRYQMTFQTTGEKPQSARHVIVVQSFPFQCRFEKANISPPLTPTLSSPPSSGDVT